MHKHCCIIERECPFFNLAQWDTGLKDLMIKPHCLKSDNASPPIGLGHMLGKGKFLL
jgi:hypothetical protein